MIKKGKHATIIFDIGDVLLQKKPLDLKQKIEVNLFKIREKIFDLLNEIEGKNKNIYGAQDEEGKKLPAILCDWLSGTKTNREIKDQIDNTVEKKAKELNNYDVKLLQTIRKIIFEPEELVKRHQIIEDGFLFAKTCKEQGHDLYILSNWDGESFELVVKKFPELFNLFDSDKIVTSGKTGLIKPDPKIYEYILTQYNLNPKECIFYDDQEVNIKGAETFGIHGVACKNLSYEQMIKELDLFIRTRIS